MRTLKKILKIVGVVLAVILLLLLSAPYLFKDQINTLIQEEANNALKADVYFEDLDLSFIRNFPNARISLINYGIVGRDAFEMDTLVQGQALDLVVNLMSIIKGDQIDIHQILLNKPKISVKILQDGTANYDIVASSEESQTTEAESSSLQISLKKYQISDGFLSYADASLPMNLMISGLNHSGRGDFTLDTYELDTETNIDLLTVDYDGIGYLNRAKAAALAKLKVSTEPHLSVSIQDGNLTLNELVLKLNGLLAMPGDDIQMDLTYEAAQTEFRNLFSLVPGIYTQEFGSVKTDGQIQLGGSVKGVYNETSLPAFALHIKVDNGMFQYPDLPTPVNNIQLDVDIDNPDGNLENTLVDIRQLHADMGNNPIDAKARISGLERMRLSGQLKGRMNLAELTSIYPIEGTVLKGDFLIDATANGIYDEKAGSFPVVDALMSMENGYVKNDEYSTELSELNFHASLKEADGNMKNAVFQMPDFHFNMDNEPVDGSLTVRNFDDPVYELRARGVLDLDKLMQIYPVDSMSLSGKLIVEDFETKGKYSDIEAENYLALPTSGTVQVENLRYSDLWYVQPGVVVSQGTARFTDSKLEIQQADGRLGQSDFSGSGYLENYLAYVLLDKPLRGNMNVRSRKFNVNEWMTDEEVSTEGTTGEEEPLEAFPIPDNLDLGFVADIGNLVYDDLNIENFQGQLTIADKSLQIQETSFGLFGSQVSMNGLYATTNPERPAYNFYLNLKELGIKDAFAHFSMVQAYAPIAKVIEGVCNLEVGLEGFLKKDMTPVLENINGLGLFEIIKGGLGGSKLMNAVAEKTKLSSISKINLEKVAAQFQIKDGYIELKPFDILLPQDIKLTLGGRQNITGEMDYRLAIDAPPGSLGNAAFGALSNLSGGAIKASERVQVNLRVGGNTEAPVVSGGGGGTGDQIKNQATDLAEDQLQKSLGTEVQLEKDSLKKQAEELSEAAKDSAKKVVEQAKQQAQDTVKKVVDKATEEAKNAAEEKVKETIGDEATETLKNLKDKFGFPKKKKKKDDGSP